MMKMGKVIVLGLALLMTQATFANDTMGHKHKHKHKEDKSQVVNIQGYTVDSDGTVRDVAGLALGKLSSDGRTIVDPSGKIVGKLAPTSAQKIDRVYFDD